MLVAVAPADPPVAAAAAQTWSVAPGDAQAFVDSVNAARGANGLAPLMIDTSMAAAAEGWTIWMTENETLQHAGDIVSGAPSDWTKVGENVGRGGSVNSVWNAFMASSGHAANVLDPSYTRIGISVIWTADGMLYTTHRFAAASSDTAPAPTPAPAPTATPAPAPTATPTANAPTSTDPTPEPTTAPAAPTVGPTTTPTTLTTPTTIPTATPSAPIGLAFGTDPVPPLVEPERLRTTMTLLLAASS